MSDLDWLIEALKDEGFIYGRVNDPDRQSAEALLKRIWQRFDRGPRTKAEPA